MHASFGQGCFGCYVARIAHECAKSEFEEQDEGGVERYYAQSETLANESFEDPKSAW